MKIPQGLTEQDVLQTIDAIVNQLSAGFRFGYHDINDMKQQGRLFALEALDKGSFDINFKNKGGKKDVNKKLYTFLFSHIRYRFINFKRDNFSRNEPPCLSCPFYDPKKLKSVNQCSAFEDKNECTKWDKWFKLNQAKQNLIKPVDISELNSDGISNTQYSVDMADKLYKNQLKDLVDEHLPANMRSDYLRFIQGCRLPKDKLDKLQNKIMEIVHANRKEDG